MNKSAANERSKGPWPEVRKKTLPFCERTGSPDCRDPPTAKALATVDMALFLILRIPWAQGGSTGGISDLATIASPRM
jgi:hypothetical protein